MSTFFHRFISHLYFLFHEPTSLPLRARGSFQGLLEKRRPGVRSCGSGAGGNEEPPGSRQRTPEFLNLSGAFCNLHFLATFLFVLLNSWDFCEGLFSFRSSPCPSFFLGRRPACCSVWVCGGWLFFFWLRESHRFAVHCCRSCLSLLRFLPPSQEL